MFKPFHYSLLAAVLSVALTGCGDAETIIVEKEPIPGDTGDDHDHDHEHEAHGRLLVLNATSPEALVYDLEENTLLDSFALPYTPSAVHPSSGYRYAALVDRTGDTVGFIDGGLWQEDHGDHLHDYEEAPLLSNYILSGSRPTHVVNHDGQLAIFYDGDAGTGTPASVQVITDEDITNENATPPSLAYSVNMHGVAEPRGEHLVATVRRDDAETTSNNPVLPDQVAVYHWHDDGYEQEQVLAEPCPDLHGAAQNETYIAFGCSDGVLLAHAHDDAWEAHKVANSEDLAEGLRIGSLYGHEHSEQFIGLASAHGGSEIQWFSINPAEGEMMLIDWQPVENATPVARGFAFAGEQFVILDNQGYLTVLEPHEHDGHTHWEYSARLDITEADVANMPGDASFSMTLAQNGHTAYVADPIAQHILIVDLDQQELIGDIELNYTPASITWLGIAEEEEHTH